MQIYKSQREIPAMWAGKSTSSSIAPSRQDTFSCLPPSATSLGSMHSGLAQNQVVPQLSPFFTRLVLEPRHFPFPCRAAAERPCARRAKTPSSATRRWRLWAWNKRGRPRESWWNCRRPGWIYLVGGLDYKNNDAAPILSNKIQYFV